MNSYDYGIIYKLTSPSGKIYIGQTIDWKKRNCYRKNNTRDNTKISKAIKKYGFDNFKFELLCKCSDADDLNEREIHCIKIFDSVKSGYNILAGGLGGGKMPDHYREQISKRLMGNSYKLGIPNSDEQKHAVKVSNQNRIITESYRKKLQNAKRKNYNKYYFFNFSSNDKFFGTIYEFSLKYNICLNLINAVIRGKRPYTYNWIIDKNEIVGHNIDLNILRNNSKKYSPASKKLI